MADIPATPAAVTPQILLQQPAAAGAAPVEAVVASVPDKIQNLIRQLQISATVNQSSSDGAVVLDSTLGSLTVLLPQPNDPQQQKLTQQFANLLQTQRQVTVLIQPGSPPTQAFIFLPPQTAQNSAASANQPLAPNIPQSPLPTDTVALSPANNLPRLVPAAGASFTAVLLPSAAPLQTAGSSAQPNAVGSVYGQPQPLNLQPASVSGSQAPLNSPAPFAQPIQPDIPETGTTPIAPNLLNTARLQSAVQPTHENNLASANLSSGNILASETFGVKNLSPTSPATNQSVTSFTQNTATTIPQLLQTLPAGKEIVFHVNNVIAASVLDSGAAISTSPAPSSPNQIAVTVTNIGTNGTAVLESGGRAFFVKHPLDVPIGTKIIVTPEIIESPPLQVTPQNNSSDLQAALNNVAQVNPQLAQQVLDNRIPQPNAALPGALLFFFSALKQSSVRTWLGSDAVDALSRSGKFELLNKITEDIHNTGKDVADPVVGTWRSYPVPIHINNYFQHLNFYVHNGYDRNQNSDSTASTSSKYHKRFVIDVSLSQMGALQLDGFTQPKKLDLTVRSEHPLPEGIHQELRQVFNNALTSIDYAGSLYFQVGRKNWLVINNAKSSTAIST